MFVSKRHLSGSRRFWSPAMTLGVGLLVLLVATAIIAPPLLSDRADTLTPNGGLPASGDHLFGTDDFGRDVLARALVATRLTLIMASAATAISVLGGLVIGLAIWLSPARVREVCLRLLETTVAYPALIFALVIAAILGPGVGSAVVAISVAGIPPFARITANLAAGQVSTDYVVTARLLGVSSPRIALRHMLPNMAEPVLVLTSTTFALSMMELSALSFIGLGVQAPAYDFGRLLTDALPALYTQPLQALAPAIMIVLTSLAALLIGDALAAWANPHVLQAALGRTAQPNPRATPEPGDDAIVRVRNLRIARADGHELVHGVSLDIRPGEVIGLVGESGSGKSLTAMAIAGLTADSLRIEADELRVGALNMLGRPARSDLAREIGIIYQDPGTTFSPSMRLGTQLTEVLRRHVGKTRAEARRIIVRLLETVNITHPERRLTQYPHELSGGMRQRAMIASALASDPKLLIADEPTTALDVTVQAEVLKQFRRIHRDSDTAILFISHDLGVVGELCSRILVMKDGRVVETTDVDHLKRGTVRDDYTKKLIAAVPVLRIGDDAAGGAHPATATTHEEGTR